MDVEICDVSKRFGKNPVLENVTLEASAGEILCLLGPSGAGKTTLIRLVIGAILPDAGTIEIGGNRMPHFGMMRRIGYMPQNDAIYSDLSGMDNLLFFAKLYGLDRKEARRRAEEMLELVGLTADRNKLAAYYSGGMKKRLSLAAALLHDPDVVILDEPTVGVDPVLRQSIWEEFYRLCKGGKTVILSTHVMDEAVKAQRAALLYRGRLLVNDTVEALKAGTSSGNLEDLFFSARREDETLWAR